MAVILVDSAVQRASATFVRISEFIPNSKKLRSGSSMLIGMTGSKIEMSMAAERLGFITEPVASTDHLVA